MSKDEKNMKPHQVELPIIGGVLLVYTATVFFQDVQNWNTKAILWFSILITLHAVMYLYRERIFKEKLRLYLLVQGILIYALSWTLKEHFQAAYLGLIPMITAQSIQLLKDRRGAVYAVLFYYTIYCAATIEHMGIYELVHAVPLLILISSAILAYGFMYTRQARAFEKTQSLLVELETAYDKIEEMARESERQKLARDIHDTLSQEMAGILMKLEALEINLEKGKIEQSKEIVKSSLIQNRAALKETREIIRDLRQQQEEEKSLTAALEHEIEILKQDANLQVNLNQSGDMKVSALLHKNIFYIIRESLTNIRKHAKASSVNINGFFDSKQILIRIEDDGIGFDNAHFNRVYGHYGVIGMYERAKAVGGKLEIESQLKYGTCITLWIMIEDLNQKEREIG